MLPQLDAAGAVVFVVDRHHRPLRPTAGRRARKLLKAGRVVVHRRHPFVVRVKDHMVGELCVPGMQVGIDHIHPRNPKIGQRGSDRVSNLAPACTGGNQAKYNMPVERFLAGGPTGLARILRQMKAPTTKNAEQSAKPRAARRPHRPGVFTWR